MSPSDPDAEVERALAAGLKPIRTLGFDAPRARLIAAGFLPIRLVAPRLAETPRADAIMGAAEMSVRGRRLLEALIAPAHSQVPVLITQADSEQPQIFAALRELGRLGEPVPAHVHFCDLLHMPREASRAYNAARLAQLDDWLVSLGGVRPDDAAIAAAQAPIEPEPELDGGDFCVLVCGTPHEGDELMRAVAACGARVVMESHAMGLGADWIPPRVASPDQVAKRIAEQVAAIHPDLVLHLSIDGDEAAPWDVARIKRALPPGQKFAALRCTSLPDDAFRAKVAALIAGDPLPAPASKPAAAAKPRPPGQGRSRKSLESVASFNAYQREWFAGVRQAVAAGSPFAVVNANAPQEVLRALDIPFVVNQWWASIVAAKQQSGRYLGLLEAQGYPTDVEAYSAQGLAAAFDMDADNAPWGGLPRPSLLHAVASSDATLKLFDNWAGETGADCFVYERSIDPRGDLFADWWVRLPQHWDSALEPERIDLMTAELRQVIAALEAKTGRHFDPERFREIMELVNEQEGYYRLTRDLVARTVPAPIGIVDSMPATMVPQWHRGTIWARDAAKAFYEEVKARVDKGLAAVPGERVRLMFVGRGLWSEMGFYQKWEESHGAVFVWSMYLALAADGYIRDLSGGRDPLRALASRVIVMGDELRMPTWAGPWYVHEAQSHAIDAVVALSDADPFVIRALRAAGLPVLELSADNFSRDSAEGEAMERKVTAFIAGPASARAEARRALA